MKLLFIFSVFILNLFGNSYEDGKKVFIEKCSSCHKEYIPLSLIKENYFEKDNSLLNLKTPTANMIVWAMMDGPNRIGDPNEPDIQILEIEKFLREYLEKPDRFNSICDDTVMNYYDNKPSMKSELEDEDYINLSYYFLEYKENLKEDIVVKEPIFKAEEEKKILERATNENKKIIVYATSKTCFFCKKMDREVLSLDEVKKISDENYIFIEVDMENSSLPFSLQKEYKKITPSFFIVNSSGIMEANYPGSWSKKDYLDILKKNIK
ncbi:thioredoxin family protein [Arcobacter vandammei]|uniref:thioredoxin family protein n=1 Tax=Arcobacter vandammei TaxID=2782243 RepID=UPI0018DFFBDE|nr:thioredoxin family protein [Arcobacter vandammei]